MWVAMLKRTFQSNLEWLVVFETNIGLSIIGSRRYPSFRVRLFLGLKSWERKCAKRKKWSLQFSSPNSLIPRTKRSLSNCSSWWNKKLKCIHSWMQQRQPETAFVGTYWTFLQILYDTSSVKEAQKPVTLHFSFSFFPYFILFFLKRNHNNWLMVWFFYGWGCIRI